MIQDSLADSDGIVIAHVDSDMEELIPGYLENRWADIRAVNAGLEQGNFETIRILGHDMKGTGAGYGFNPITDIGARLEQAAKDQNQEEIRTLVGGLTSYLERVEVVYE